MKLTEHFDLKEFCVSDQYPDMAKKIKFTRKDIHKAFLLCKSILEPVRDYVGKPIQINSGKRSKLLNLAIGGVPSSHHRFRGYDAACDWKFKSVHSQNPKLFQAYKFIAQNMKYNFGQLIIYLDRKKDPIFIHVSLPTDDKIGQCLVKLSSGAYVPYVEGEHF